MSIYSYLKQDHTKIKALIDKINRIEMDNTSLNDELYNQLKKEIIIHSKAEEKIFYQPLNHKKGTKEEVSHAKKEHAEVEEMLENLTDSSLNGAAWGTLFKKMCEALLHHIEEEESTLFPDAKQEISTEESEKMEAAVKKEKKRKEETMSITLRKHAAVK